MSSFRSLCDVTFSRPLIGQKRECYIIEQVIEVDELDKDNISAAAEMKLPAPQVKQILDRPFKAPFELWYSVARLKPELLTTRSCYIPDVRRNDN